MSYRSVYKTWYRWRSAWCLCVGLYTDTRASLELFSNVIVGIALFHFNFLLAMNSFQRKNKDGHRCWSRHIHAVLLSILLFTWGYLHSQKSKLSQPKRAKEDRRIDALRKVNIISPISLALVELQLIMHLCFWMSML